MPQPKEDRLYQGAQTACDAIRGAKMGTKNYKLTLPETGNNFVNVIDKTRGNIRKGAPVGDWVVRFDQPHGGANFEHININPRVAGIPRDPHIRISPNTLSAARTTGKVLKNANKVMVPLAVAMDGYRIAENMYDDYSKGTSRNTVESIAGVAGGWAGGCGGISTRHVFQAAYGFSSILPLLNSGAAVGATIGTAAFPGVGTIIGGVVGGVSAAIGGSYLAEGLTSTVCERFQHDIIEVKCKECGKKYQCRKYLGQSQDYCDSCLSRM